MNHDRQPENQPGNQHVNQCDHKPGIGRDIDAALDQVFDVIVIGGGVYGAATLLEAARRGKRALLLERDDFGAATSWNSLRIVHGGLRYLQKLDLHRFRESVGERQWFCANFPDLVQPLTCLLPLYGQGLKRPWIFRVALAMNDYLSRHRNEGVPVDTHLKDGRVLSPAETIARFGSVDRDGLRGAGLWHDAMMTNSQRVLVEMLRWAGGLGATALNYVKADDLIIERGRVRGVTATDTETGRRLTFGCRDGVINCAGPWSQTLAQSVVRGQTFDGMFRPSLACNLLLNREPVSDCAVAVQPRRPGSRVYFVVPWHGRLFAGTYHAPWHDGLRRPGPDQTQLKDFLDDLNGAVPGLALRRSDVLRVYAGLLPAREDGGDELAVREVVLDHSHHGSGGSGSSGGSAGSGGGPRGLVSVSGVKFTTARRVGEKALAALLGTLPTYRADSARPASRLASREAPEPGWTRGIDLTGLRDVLADDAERAIALEAALADMQRHEAALHLDDILLRRTDWGADPGQIDAVARRVASALGWSSPRLAAELARLRSDG